MFGWKRIADWKRSCAELQRQHDALAKQYDGLAKKYDALNVRYNAVNQEIGDLRVWIKRIETEAGGLAELYSGVANSHAHEIKRVNDLQEQARQAGRKKVRRRDPQTGRFIWDYPEELSE